MALSMIELCEQLAEANVQDFGDSARPVMNAPATLEELSDLEAHWGHPLPESYRDLMTLSNGFEGLVPGMTFFSVADLIEENETREFWDELVPEISAFLIAWGPGSGSALFLDPETMQGEDEMELVEMDEDMKETRYVSLQDYLEQALETRRISLSKKTSLN